jgi:hypothetical protein
MATAMSTYLADALLNHVFRGIPYTQPTDLFIGAFTTATDDGSGGTEVSGSGYARVQVSANALKFTVPAANGGVREITNVDPITWPTASGSWGTITHIALYDSLSGGNRLYHGALTASQAIASGQALNIPAGSLALNLT